MERGGRKGGNGDSIMKRREEKGKANAGLDWLHVTGFLGSI